MCLVLLSHLCVFFSRIRGPPFLSLICGHASASATMGTKRLCTPQHVASEVAWVAASLPAVLHLMSASQLPR